MKCGQLCGHFVSLPRLRLGHITSGYLATVLRVSEGTSEGTLSKTINISPVLRDVYVYD